MDRTDQFPTLTLAGNDRVATRVDYRACDRCGFRLMRVETTIINDQHLIETRCPICEQFDKDDLKQLDASALVEERSRYFDAWLATHDLNRDTLESHYHLGAEHFFEDQN